jgi:SAM-dependent methyltransferase
MKVRDSGMPEQEYWESLFDIATILDELGIDARVNDAVEVGCGYGTFTLPVAQRIRGTLHSFDIETEMIEQTRARLAQADAKNVTLQERDVVAEGFSLPGDSVDAVLLFNILHAENPVELLRTSAGVLRPGGRILAIHWRSDVTTPRGPDLAIRAHPEHIIDWGRQTGMLVADEAHRILPPWHFGVTLSRVAC